MPSLTSHLLQLDEAALREATTPPFVAAAATGSLPPSLIKSWLAQDRLYALAYVNFIGCLLARIPIPTASDRNASLEWRTIDFLIDFLTAVRQEIKMSEDTAQAEGWLKEICDGVQPSVHTKMYQDLLAASTAQERPLLVGLTLWWATEETYLRSWTFARSKMNDHREGKGKEKEGEDVMQRVFVLNWSSAELEAFVKRMGGLVDEFAGKVEEGGWEWRECELVWRQVVFGLREFWPKIEGEEEQGTSK